MARIAVIEDSRIDRSYQAAVLRKAGWEVAFIEPTETLVMIGQLLENPPDLLLLDYMLPQLRGDSIAEVCHRHPVLKTIPIVVLTAHKEASLRQRLLALGVREVLYKPISQFLLAEAVQRHLPGGTHGEPFSLDPN
jgi:two-component system phosphate regulon response regulator PhoB